MPGVEGGIHRRRRRDAILLRAEHVVAHAVLAVGQLRLAHIMLDIDEARRRQPVPNPDVEVVRQRIPFARRELEPFDLLPLRGVPVGVEQEVRRFMRLGAQLNVVDQRIESSEVGRFGQRTGAVEFGTAHGDAVPVWKTEEPQVMLCIEQIVGIPGVVAPQV
jgi:hypothetical protein